MKTFHANYDYAQGGSVHDYHYIGRANQPPQSPQPPPIFFQPASQCNPPIWGQPNSPRESHAISRGLLEHADMLCGSWGRTTTSNNRAFQGLNLIWNIKPRLRRTWGVHALSCCACVALICIRVGCVSRICPAYMPYVFHLCFTYLSLMSRLCGTHVSPLFQS